MPPHVISHIPYSRKRFVAVLALERLLSTVDSHVNFKIALLREWFAAVWMLAVININWHSKVIIFYVLFNFVQSNESFLAVLALVNTVLFCDDLTLHLHLSSDLIQLRFMQYLLFILNVEDLLLYRQKLDEYIYREREREKISFDKILEISIIIDNCEWQFKKKK